MEKDNGKSSKKILLIVALVIVVIAVLVIGIVVVNVLPKHDDTTGNNESNEINGEDLAEQLKGVNFYEEFSKIESVKNLEDVVWNSIRITQIENLMQVSISLNNLSETAKVEATNLTVNLYDNEGNLAYSKEAQMEELSENYGTTMVELEFEIDDISLIYDVDVIANQ